MAYHFITFTVLVILSTSQTQAASNHQLEIFYPSFSQLEDVEKRSNTVNADYIKIVKYLNNTGLTYKFYSAPWKRALLNSNNNTNALIVYLDRTPEREKFYHWLLLLGSTQNIIYGPITLLDKKTTISTLQYTGGTAVCIRASEQCNIFRGIGFSEEDENLIISSSAKVMSHELAKKGRADYFIVDKDYFKMKSQYDLLLRSYKALFPLKKKGIYMAAPKNIDQNLLKKLTAAITKQ